ncbi:MAG: amphi-Trp domain-containing protein [Gammaproteobacteria bacterium]|nr:MAG: amphi-Trp domain-containing protein [Gammaproteobacteria bacterium]
MRQGKANFRHDSLQDAKSIQEILESLSGGLAKGKITFTDDDDKIVMKPGGLLDLKVTASQEDSRNRISIRISWQSKDDKKKKKKLSVSSK